MIDVAMSSVRAGEVEGLLFVNKKKQKNFVNLAPWRVSASGQKSQKFLRRFFQKAATFFTLCLFRT
jgi:hypothetical protein